ncbi:hypothetical protein chiPu_0004857 [Chiloscyllium punctatum]|uniref:Uncharacterized protein n=1 Tax=Chiloscyllium punctatum TaxID=137246 RepID=A0A401S7X5_CHIPU|nr:hypothetical protein [Chiloscyllium punctatum]
MQKNHGHEYEGLGAPKPPWRISLAGRKTGLYRPDLPTLRRMNMDDEASKLPNEHCRNTTTCTAGNKDREPTEEQDSGWAEEEESGEG